jgi:hypothetical protein
LRPLKLERATFTTQIESDSESPGPQGIDRIEFWVQTNPGTRPGPLMKVASGGELSRFLLALKVVLADRGSAPTLVFDEIDTGVGGAVADAIGTRLARLAAKVQVMAVTHAPQVAARAGQHLLISKDALDKGKRVATRVNALAADHRREEIARMLAGAEITAEARAAAERLLKAAIVSRMATKAKKPLTEVDTLTRAQGQGRADAVALENREPRQILLQAGLRRRFRMPEYDALRQRFNAIDSRFPELVTSDRRRRKKSAAQPSGRFAKVRHAVPMLSLDNALSRKPAWSISSPASGRFLKLGRRRQDRLSAPSRRSTGFRCRCVTKCANSSPPRPRGDGAAGRGCHRNIRTLEDVPKKARKAGTCPDVCEVRGEGLHDQAGLSSRSTNGRRRPAIPSSPIRAIRRQARCARRIPDHRLAPRSASLPIPGAR